MNVGEAIGRRPGPTLGDAMSLSGSEPARNGNGSEIIEESTDLVNWTPIPGASSPLEVEAPTSDTRRFYRMKRLP